MTHEERKALEARRQHLVKARDEAVGQANQYAGGIAVIDSLLAASDKVEIGSFTTKANGQAAANGEELSA
jgi:hypothetical protein